ncbi:uncharacterized protein PSANT_06977 [Moesziomyces antarcticus]|uniref:Uncharacterized protein n=1 Tax=Pseudozyma antarctica TaxID=84753 RepID=A0A5C3FYL7_PSEA2|nr:uncharacterized protein PSANT_06977 [Moesziomyces antarcticus]
MYGGGVGGGGGDGADDGGLGGAKGGERSQHLFHLSKGRLSRLARTTQEEEEELRQGDKAPLQLAARTQARASSRARCQKCNHPAAVERCYPWRTDDTVYQDVSSPAKSELAIEKVRFCRKTYIETRDKISASKAARFASQFEDIVAPVIVAP